MLDNKKPDMDKAPVIRHIQVDPNKNLQKPEPQESNLSKIIHNRGNMIASIATVAGVIGLLAGGYAIHKSRDFKQYTALQMVKNENTYNGLKAQYKKLKNVEVIDPTAGQTELASGVKQGDKLAELQNKFATMKATNKNMHKMKVALKQLYASSDDDTVPWFSPGKSRDAGTWKFESRFTFSQTKMQVLFTDTDTHGRLLAYTVADYLPNKKQFTNMKTTVTVNGNANIAKTGGPSKQQQKKDLDKSINEIRKATKGKKNYKISHKEANELQKQRDEAYAKAKKEGKIK